ncbi:MAG: hypothetical protein WKF96_19910, partial [Solirubrobacteraceae bacterium]
APGARPRGLLWGAPEAPPAADTAAPAAAKQAKLPDRAARLLASTDAGTASGHARGHSEDPFAPPSSYRAAIAAAAAKTASSTSAAKTTTSAAQGATATTQGTSDKPIPVVIKNPGSTTPSTPNDTTSNDDSTAKSTPSRKLTARNASVDARFGPKADTRIKRSIARQQGFYIHGKLVAMFVKYSPSRNAAVFAVAPGLHITGAVKCRVAGGACRYVDIPAGEHVWLTYITPNRTIVNRRLDVVRIKRRSAGSSTTAASASTRSEAACLMHKLVGMERGDALLDRDACER